MKTVYVALLIGVQAASSLALPPAPSSQPATRTPVGVTHDAASSSTTITLYDGSKVTIGRDGLGWRTDAAGTHSTPVALPRTQARSRATGDLNKSDLSLLRQFSLPARGVSQPNSVLILFDPASEPSPTLPSQTLPAPTVDGDAPPRAGRAAPAASVAATPFSPDSVVDAALRSVGVRSISPLLGSESTFRSSVKSGQLTHLYLAQLAGGDARAAAQQLRKTRGVRYAEPNWFVSSMATDPASFPDAAVRAAAARSNARGAKAAGAAAISDGAIADNYGVGSSLQSFLNSSGINALPAQAEIQRRFGQLAGEGTIITNVSIGDLTDQAMADAGDFYVQVFGPTSTSDGTQRYLDYPSLPLIPTYVVDPAGNVDPNGTVEFVDPFLGEVLLDFSVMAPLPHDKQRPGAEGSGLTDLLGIAPGAQYRLVVPQEPTIANILVAMSAAAQQSPRPDVITASLGFGFDGYGFPGRYLEDDPIAQSVVKAIVDAGIVVTISSNDGTRVFTNAAVPPSGGSAPTDVPGRNGIATSVADDGFSTIPSVVPDSGAIAVGGTTLDDIFSAPPHGSSPLSHEAVFSTTRYNGSIGFSSGFGSRVNVSAPSDNIASFLHYCQNVTECTPHDLYPVLNGGTSASAPMTAAAAAIMIQVSRLTGAALGPIELRQLLVESGRPVALPPQADRRIDVGPQLDVAGALQLLLARRGIAPLPSEVVRIGVAARQNIGGLGSLFMESVDANTVDLKGPYFFDTATGQNSYSPITLSADVIGKTAGLSYRWTINNHGVINQPTSRSLRLLPAEWLKAAGFNFPTDLARTFPVKVELRKGNKLVASGSTTITLGPSDGSCFEALAPLVPPAIKSDSPVTVKYDISHVIYLNKPQLAVSNIGHWSPATAPLFRPDFTIDLTALEGTVTIPAGAFAAGAGLYGIGIVTDSESYNVGEFAPIRVGNIDIKGRPTPPSIAADGSSQFGHQLSLSRNNSKLQLQWDVNSVAGATDAVLELSAPGPNIYGLYNIFANGNGDRRDAGPGENRSSLYRKLGGTSGTITLDLLEEQIPTSLFYSARILPVAGDKVVGQASEVVSFQFDDGLPSTGNAVVDFDTTPGSPATVSTITYSSDGRFSSGQILHYDPATGTYGSTLIGDEVNDYHHLGVDPALHRGLILGSSNYGPEQTISVIDTTDGSIVSSTVIDAWNQNYLQGGRVDAARHRGALLGWNTEDYSDTILPVDMQTGQIGAGINADGKSDRRAVFTSLDIDPSTGRVLPARVIPGDLCFFFGGGIGSVDLDTGAVAEIADTASCLTGIATDQSGKNAYMTLGPLTNYILLPPGRLQTIDQSTLTVSDPVDLDARSSFFPVVDPVNNLLLVGFLAQSDYYSRNNVMSAVGVYDLATGKLLELMPQMNLFGPSFVNYLFQSARGIQIDPATRTGWTYGPGAGQVQQFKY